MLRASKVNGVSYSDGELAGNLFEQLCMFFRKRCLSFARKRNRTDDSSLKSQRRHADGPQAEHFDTFANPRCMKFLEIDVVTKDCLACADSNSCERAFHRQQCALSNEASLTASLDRMRAQLFRFLVVDRKRREIVRQTFAQRLRNRVQQVMQIQIGYNGVIDVEQKAQTLVGQTILGNLGEHLRPKFIRL